MQITTQDINILNPSSIVRNAMKRTAVIVCILAMTFLAGAEVSARLTGDVIVQRNVFGDCKIIDTKHGTDLGTMSKDGGRCHIRDWRMWHPFF